MSIDDADVARWLITRGGHLQRGIARDMAEAGGMDVGSDDDAETPPNPLVEALLFFIWMGHPHRAKRAMAG